VQNLVTLTAVKNCSVKHGVPVDHVCSNNDNGLKLTKDEENYWHSVQLFEYSLRTKQHVTVPEEELEGEEEQVAEGKVIFVHTERTTRGQKLHMPDWYQGQYNKLENKMYRLRAKQKENSTYLLVK
jgi:hypothetical protein